MLQEVQVCMGVDADEAQRILDLWSPEPLTRGNELIGLGMLRGREIHFAVHPGKIGSVLTHRLSVREFLRGLLGKQDFLTTRIPLDNPFQNRFVKIVGFTPTWSDGSFNYYILTEAPFAPRKDSTCPRV